MAGDRDARGKPGGGAPGSGVQCGEGPIGLGWAGLEPPEDTVQGLATGYGVWANGEAEMGRGTQEGLSGGRQMADPQSG